MPQKRVDSFSGRSPSTAPISVEVRRRAKRAYMRRWRSDKTRHERERALRLARYQKKKRRQGCEKRQKMLSDTAGQPVCAICGSRRPVRQVARLRVCEFAPSGYQEVLIPYCGEC